MKLKNKYKRLPRNYTILTDEYEYKMASSYFKSAKKDNLAAFDIFFRSVPNGGGYAIMAGLDKIIDFIENIKFDEQSLNYFRVSGYDEDFIEYLKNFKFTGTIKAIPDGTPVFPNEPIITIIAPLIESQILETALLAFINGSMEHATAARRIIEATPEAVPVMEFGARRADGTEAAIDASIYGIIAGCVGTSNVLAANMLGIKAMGTMAHSYIESYDDELDAFIDFATTYPENATLLVDTFDTLRSGVPNAIKTFKYMEEYGISTEHIGIRIDSGDLAYLSKEARRMLDSAGFKNAKICLSNGLTAETIETLISQGAKFDSLGVGDNISKPDGRMGCVYKEVALESNGKWIPKIKLSEDTIKIVNPGIKNLYRAYDVDTGYAIADIMCGESETIDEAELIIVSPTDYLKRTKISNFKLVQLQQTIFDKGKLVFVDMDIDDKKIYCASQMATIYPEVKRTNKPAEYHVSGTEAYVDFKNHLIEQHKSKVLK